MEVLCERAASGYTARMQLPFTKMHGLGNDFVLVDGFSQIVELSAEQIRSIADRHLGVGCDQLLLVEPPSGPEVDFRYRIFNADGGEVEQCGNGARCFARFVRDQGLTHKDNIHVETNAGVLGLQLESDGRVSVDMGRPRLEPAEIPFIARQRAPIYRLQIDSEALSIGAVSMGNPHAVLCVPDVASAPVRVLGPLLESHERFPERVNVGFMEIVSRCHIRLRVYERGVGETRACGSGACAAVVAGCEQGVLDQAVRVDLPGGCLDIYWDGGAVIMTGPTAYVFKGYIEL